jgi:uncharacterized protein (TIGR03435 family)
MRASPAVLASLAFAAGALLHAQTTTFDVASIRRNPSKEIGGLGLAAPQPGGRFVAVGATLRRLIGDAYDVDDVEGGPAWVSTDRFDVNARAEGNSSPDEIRRLLRSLLAERFALKVHTVMREVPAYALTTVREDRAPGPGLKRSSAQCAEDARRYFPVVAPGGPVPCGDFRLGARMLSARGMTMTRLAGLLKGRVERPVLDRTGLDGAFDLELEWSSDLGLSQAPPGAAGATELRPDGLSLFTALQDQLGLRLQPTRGTVEVIVVDRAEPPTPD